MTISAARALKIGDRFSTRVLLTRAEEKTSKKGGTVYVTATFCDHTGKLTTAVFIPGMCEELLAAGKQETSAVFDTRFLIEEYQGAPSFRLEEAVLLPVSATTPEVLAGLLEKSPVPKAILDMEFDQALRSLREDLRTIVTRLLETRYKGFDIWPAANSVHHDYVHGLKEHTVRMLRQIKMLAKLYDANVDVCIAATILHDAAKVLEYKGPGRPGKTLHGNLFGHVYLSAALFRMEATRYLEGWASAHEQEAEAGTGYERFDTNLDFLNVEHCIASHHGKLEYGAIVVPLTKEALLLHGVDSIDAHVCALMKATAGLSPGDMTTDTLLALDRNHGIVLSKGRPLNPE